MALLFKQLTPTAKLPTRAHPGDAGLDLYADEYACIAPGEWALVFAGVATAIPDRHVGLVCSRSGLALKHGISVLNSPGVVDSPYRGSIGVILMNHGKKPFVVEPGMRIAQLVVTSCRDDGACWISSLPESERDQNGFGSSG